MKVSLGIKEVYKQIHETIKMNSITQKFKPTDLHLQTMERSPSLVAEISPWVEGWRPAVDALPGPSSPQ